MCSGKRANPSNLFADTSVWCSQHCTLLRHCPKEPICLALSIGTAIEYMSVLQTRTDAEANLPRASLLWKCVPECQVTAATVPLAEQKGMFSKGWTVPEQTLPCTQAQISTDSKSATKVFSLKLFSPSGQIDGSQNSVNEHSLELSLWKQQHWVLLLEDMCIHLLRVYRHPHLMSESHRAPTHSHGTV